MDFSLKTLQHLVSEGCKFCIDTRFVPDDGNVFVALKAQRDGHDFVLDAFAKGAKYCVVAKSFTLSSLTSDIDLINKLSPKLLHCDSDDVLTSITNVARQKADYLHKEGTKIFTITGSVGKTTVKNLTYFLLQKYLAYNKIASDIYKTQKNYNNHIGVPLTLFNCGFNLGFLVCEIGMDRAGEIDHLASVIKPDIAIITNISDVHRVNFASTDDIARAKGECIKYARLASVLNHDCECFDILQGEALLCGARHATTGKSDISNYVFDKGATKFTIFNKYKFTISRFLSQEYLLNIALCLRAFGELGIDLDFLQSVNFDDFFNSADMAGRGREIKLQDFTIIDEVYNCSPQSLANAIQNLAHKDGDKLAIIGDMLELGDVSRQKHEEIFTLLNENKINGVVMIGEQMRFLYNKFLQANASEAKIEVHYYQNLTSFLQAHLLDGKLVGFRQRYDFVLLKASNSMGFTKVVEALIYDADKSFNKK